MAELQCIESLCERIPQSVLQLSIFILMLQFKRLELLFDSTFGIDIQTLFALTWILPVYSIIKSYISYNHRNRYPICPGIVGSVLQTTSMACLVIPKLVLISMSLLNSMFIHPILMTADILMIHLVHKYFFEQDIKIFESAMMSIAPAYVKGLQTTPKNGNEMMHKMKLGAFITLIPYLCSLVLYLCAGWFLRNTVFFYNIFVEDDESFIKDVALNQNFITYYWLVFIGFYVGCGVLHIIFNCVYYVMGHPWSMTRDEEC